MWSPYYLIPWSSNLLIHSQFRFGTDSQCNYSLFEIYLHLSNLLFIGGVSDSKVPVVKLDNSIQQMGCLFCSLSQPHKMENNYSWPTIWCYTQHIFYFILRSDRVVVMTCDLCIRALIEWKSTCQRRLERQRVWHTVLNSIFLQS